MLGSSTTALAQLLARALRPLWQAGDEVVVTDLDHETNVGAWRRLEETGIVVREWRFRRDTATLELEDLEALLSERTRLVAFTHCSNVVGNVHDARAMAQRVRDAGALSCVDGVAFAPHRAVDVRALGVDFYLVSLYKVFGPHVGLLYGRRELLARARGQNHFFVGEDQVPGKLEPGGAAYELVAALPGILEYFAALDRHHGGDGSLPACLERVHELVSEHETRLVQPLLSFLDEHPRVSLIGSPRAAAATRVPTVAFTVEGLDSSVLPPRLEQQRLAARYGHFYAQRAIRGLGLLERNGVVRVSLAHYNTRAEVSRLLDALENAIPGR